MLSAAAADNAQRLPDPFLDGLFIGDEKPVVRAALEEDGWETSEEWFNESHETILRLLGERDNRKLLYSFDLYDQLTSIAYLEQWSSIAGCKEAYTNWKEWLKFCFGEPLEEENGATRWHREGVDIKLYDRTYIAGESERPTMMVDIYPLREP